MKKIIFVIVTILISNSSAAQSIFASYPDQYPIISLEGGKVISEAGKNTAKMGEVIAEQHIAAQMLTVLDRWNQEYNDYLKDPSGLASNIKLTNTLYLQGAELMRNIFQLKKAIKANPEGIAATVPMNNLYMETAALIIKCYRTLKVITNTITEEDSTAIQVTPVQPIPYETGCIRVTVTIQNKTDKNITFDGKVCFILHGYMPSEDYTGHKSFHGICSGGDYTIPAGGSRTYTVIFKKEDTPTDGLGLPFAGEGHTGSRMANNAYYIGNKGFFCENISESVTFREGGSYTMVIPQNTAMWYKGSDYEAHMLTGAERLQLLWDLANDIRELNKKIKKTAISIAYYQLSDVWDKATEGMIDYDHKRIARRCLDKWSRAIGVSNTLSE